jgi:hypothetical protein
MTFIGVLQDRAKRSEVLYQSHTQTTGGQAGSNKKEKNSPTPNEKEKDKNTNSNKGNTSGSGGTNGGGPTGGNSGGTVGNGTNTGGPRFDGTNKGGTNKQNLNNRNSSGSRLDSNRSERIHTGNNAPVGTSGPQQSQVGDAKQGHAGEIDPTAYDYSGDEVIAGNAWELAPAFRQHPRPSSDQSRDEYLSGEVISPDVSWTDDHGAIHSGFSSDFDNAAKSPREHQRTPEPRGKPKIQKHRPEPADPRPERAPSLTGADNRIERDVNPGTPRFERNLNTPRSERVGTPRTWRNKGTGPRTQGITNRPERSVDSLRQVWRWAKREFGPPLMAIAEIVRYKEIRKRIEDYSPYIRNAATSHEDVLMIMAISFEEQIHEFPPRVESWLEDRGAGASVGPTQIDVQLWAKEYGTTRAALLNPKTHFLVTRKHLEHVRAKARAAGLEATPEIIGSIWNYDDATTVTDYGRRVGRFYEMFANELSKQRRLGGPSLH